MIGDLRGMGLIIATEFT